MRRARAGAGREAATLVEAIIFGAIASLVFVGLIGLLSKGSKIVELGRRTSGSSTDLKILLETLSEDAAELVYVENDGNPYSSEAGGSKLAFVVRSTRAESGLPDAPAGATGLRRIEYRLEGTEKLKDCIRAVTVMGPSGPVGAPVDHALVRKGIGSLKVWPVAAIPVAGKYKFTMAKQAAAKTGGATMACLVVEVSAGEASGDTAIEGQTVMKLATKLWCRNRLLEMSRGALR